MQHLFWLMKYTAEMDSFIELKEVEEWSGTPRRERGLDNVEIVEEAMGE